MRSRFTRVPVAAAMLMGLATSAAAQLGVSDRAVPGTYAITNARIIPVSGPTIDRGTIVIRNGLIVSVGASVPVPADASVIDGSGHTVYPGLIDALSNLGIPTPRGAGITATLFAPRDGIFQGQSAFINLAGSNAQEMLVRSPVALHVGFTPLRGGGFPGSLLGVFAAQRQMLLDAQRYRELQAAYARNPRGMRRPDADPSLAALQPVLSKEMPVVMLANTQREIERALDLANEFGLKAYIAGGEEAWRVSDRLKRENVPVIATLNFPRRAANVDADADPEPLRVLQSRVDIPRNPGKLAGAGVSVAFTSAGVGMSDFLANVRKVVTDGMTRDQAIRALTL